MNPVAAYISEICRLYVVVLLLASAGGKSFAFHEFERTISESVNIPARFSRFIALGIIGAEYLAALTSAIGGASAQFGIATAFSLSVLFAGFVVTMLAQAKSVRCNCFGGGSSDKISALDLVRNAILMTSCAFYLLGARPTQSPSAAAYLLLLATALIGLLFTVNLKSIFHILRDW